MLKMKKLKQDQSGSALVWVLIIGIVLVILIWALSWVAHAINNRTINNNLTQQAYFTARSAVDAIYNQIGSTNEIGQYIEKNVLSKESEDLIPIVSDMGFEKVMADNCSVAGKYKEGQLTLMATAEKSGQIQNVELVIQRVKNSGGEGKWPSMENGIALDKDQGNGKIELEENIGEKGWVYVLNKTNTNGAGKQHWDELEIYEDNTHPAIFIYVKADQTLSLKEVDDWSDAKIKPDIFIYLENTATLDIKAGEEYPFFINGATGSKIVVSNDNDHKSAKIYNFSGATVEGNLEIATPQKTPNSNYPIISTPSDGTSGGVELNKWEKVQYKNAD